MMEPSLTENYRRLPREGGEEEREDPESCDQRLIGIDNAKQAASFTESQFGEAKGGDCSRNNE